MARRIYLYIGLPKTGTTFLQTTMWHNRKALQKRGFLYPGSQPFDHYRALAELRKRGAADKAPKPHWERLTRQLRKFDGDGLVSHEFFSMLKKGKAAKVVADLEPAEVHLVVTARSYVLQWPAVWQEGLKMFVDAPFDEFMAGAETHELPGAWSWRSQDLPAVLGAWKDLVPPERTHVITVPPPGAPRDLLWKRWCEAVSIDDTGFDHEVNFANASMGAAQAALMLRLKPALTGSLLDSGTRHRWVRQYFGHEVLGPQGGARFGPRPDLLPQLREKSEQTVRAVRRRGYHVVGDLDDLLYDELPDSGAHPDDTTTEEMLDVAVRAIEQMIRDVRELSLERDDLLAKEGSRPRSRLERLAKLDAEEVRSKIRGRT